MKTIKKLIFLVTLTIHIAISEEIEHCKEYYKPPPPEPTSSSSSSIEPDPPQNQATLYQEETQTGCKVCEDSYFSGPESQEKINHFLCYSCPRTCETCQYFKIGDQPSDFSKSFTCKKCKIQYFLDPPESEEYIQHKCNPCTQGCLTCTSLDKCDECKVTYFTKEDGKCGKCPIECKKCRSTDDCDICLEGFYKDKRKAQKPDELCQKCMNNCKLCYGESSCEECIEGYSYDKKAAKCSKKGALLILILSGAGVLLISILVLVICCSCSKRSKKLTKKGKKNKNKDDSQFNSFGGSIKSDEGEYHLEKEKVGIADRYKGNGVNVKDEVDWDDF